MNIECSWPVSFMLTNTKRSSIWLSLLLTNTSCLSKLKSRMFHYMIMIFHVFPSFQPFWTIKTIDVTVWLHKSTWHSDVTSWKTCNIIQLLTYVEVDMESYWTVNVILTDAERRSIWLSLLFNNTPCLPKHKSTIVLLYNKFILCISCHFRPLKCWRYKAGSCEVTWRSDVTSRKPVNITSCCVLCNVTSGKPCNM